MTKLVENYLQGTANIADDRVLATGTKPIHLLSKQSTTKCGYFLYTGGILIENTTTDKSKVTCKNCLRAK